MQAVMDDYASPSAAAGNGQLWGEYGRRVRLLRRIGLFQDVEPVALAHLATALQPRSAAAGAVICREGDPVERLSIVESGTLVVSIGSGGEQRTLGKLVQGEYFGEVAFLGDGHSTTTVRAETAVQLWTLPAEELHELCRRIPAIELTLLRASHLRLADERQRRLAVAGGNLAALAAQRQPLVIGRAPVSELVFRSPNISARHALFEPTASGYRLQDLGSRNGTWVNGRAIDTVELQDGDEIRIGEERLRFDRRAPELRHEPRGIRIAARHLSKQAAGQRTVLDDISLEIAPGELVAIIGGSGAGKSTLLDALAGVRPATSGVVTYNGEDYYANRARFRSDLGYVPQDDIIHTALPVRRTLEHAAKLRLPPGTSRREIADVVEQTIAVLGLTAHAETRVQALSGGQRKRCSIGVELLTRPRVFFLDEPTSGLDPATEIQLMQLLRQLADQGNTVVLTTHASSTLGMCDKVITLAQGGTLAFVGTPQRALSFFAVGSFGEIYDRLADGGATWAARFRAKSETQALPIAPSVAEKKQRRHQARGGDPLPKRLRRGVRQFTVLTGRTVDLLIHSRASLISLVVPPLLIALVLLALFRAGAFGATPNPSVALQTLLFLGYGALFFGLTAGLQEITKELAIFRRERTVDLGIAPYLGSKLAVLLPFLLLNTVVLTGVLRLAGRLPDAGWAVYGQLLLSLGLNAAAGLGLGLFISAAVSSSEVATRLQSLVLIPQIVFSGGLLAVSAMGGAGKVISAAMAMRWGFEALGQATDLNALFLRSGGTSGAALYEQYHDAFAGNIWADWAIVGCFFAGTLLLAGLILRRKGVTR